MAPVSFIRLGTLIDASSVADRISAHGNVTSAPEVKLRMYDAVGTIDAADFDDAVVLRARLPTGGGIFELTHQARGIQSRLRQLREQKIGVAALDDAFIVRCDDDGFSLLRRVSDELLALLPCPSEAHIHVDHEHLTVAWSANRLDAMLHVWERLHAVRIGA